MAGNVIGTVTLPLRASPHITAEFNTITILTSGLASLFPNGIPLTASIAPPTSGSLGMVIAFGAGFACEMVAVEPTRIQSFGLRERAASGPHRLQRLASWPAYSVRCRYGRRSSGGNEPGNRDVGVCSER
jgi:hypothetical protein